jgi:hypothetical protein
MRFLLTVLTLSIATPALAQTTEWTSTDIGAVSIAGGATQANGVWTVSGDGSDIWGTADSFQFLHQKSAESGAVTMRVADLQNTSPFAKAGLMVRDGLGADAATVIFDVKPDGGLELMWRQSAGGAMQFLIGQPAAFPVWLRLEYGRRGTIPIGVEAWTSQDGLHWTFIRGAPTVSATPDVGVAVTSHESGQLTTAHIDHLTLDPMIGDWISSDVGASGVSGGATKTEGIWTVLGAGADVWGPADAFRFLRRSTDRTNQHVRVRVNDLQNTSPFAKSGVMLRTTADPDSPTVILDVKPDGGVEFMVRETWGGEMRFLDGLAAPSSNFGTWLDLSWREGGNGQPATVRASVSRDGVSFLVLAGAPHVYFAESFLAGVAVSSHDTSRTATSRLQALSLLPDPAVSGDIGFTGIAGNAATELTVCCPALIVEGSGSDIWGVADSFEFVHGLDPIAAGFGSPEVDSLVASHPFAKAGLMYRDGFDPGAATVIVDVKPDGGIEFMARRCAGCPMEFIAGAQGRLPVVLGLFRNADGTFSAGASDPTGNPAARVDFGTITVPMSTPISGYAVTSHDTSHTATAVFSHPIH